MTADTCGWRTPEHSPGCVVRTIFVPHKPDVPAGIRLDFARMSTPQAHAPLPMLSLGTGLVACSAVGAAVAMGLGVAGGWASGPELAKASILSAATVVAAGGIAMAMLWAICLSDATRFAMALVACSSGRMLLSVGLAYMLAVGVGLEQRAVWAGVLASGLLFLVYETVVGVIANQRICGSSPATGAP